MIGAAVCFFVSFMTLPLLAIKSVTPTSSTVHLIHITQTHQICALVQVNRMSLPFPNISPSAAWEVSSSCSGTSPFHLLSQHPPRPPLDSFSVLIGPINHLKHLISTERLPFSVTYFASLALTLYFSLGVRPSTLPLILPHIPHQPKSYLGSILSGAVQVVALVAYVLAYFPGGTQTIRLGGQLALRGAGSILPR